MPLQDHGFQPKGGCTFIAASEASFGVVWLVEGQTFLKGSFMPRLSVGLNAVGRDVAVLSRDLHQLVAPESQTQWYLWRDDEAPQRDIIEEVLNVGLPWIRKHMDLESMAQALEQGAYFRERAEGRRWLFSSPKEPRLRVNSNNLQFLSYCREAQGRYSEALGWWDKYISTHTLFDQASELARQLKERRDALAAGR